MAPLYEMKKSLDWEVDKFQGFVRFTEYDGMLGAVIHPKNYILPLLRGHFCGRFPEENFMIYDAVHQAVLLYQNHKATLTELAVPAGAAPAPAPGSRSFRPCGSSFTIRWRSRPATMKPAGCPTAPSASGRICRRCRAADPLIFIYNSVIGRWLEKTANL